MCCAWAGATVGGRHQEVDVDAIGEVGRMRPAEVWGWYKYPFSSRSLIVLRIDAGDRPS